MALLVRLTSAAIFIATMSATGALAQSAVDSAPFYSREFGATFRIARYSAWGYPHSVWSAALVVDAIKDGSILNRALSARASQQPLSERIVRKGDLLFVDCQFRFGSPLPIAFRNRIQWFSKLTRPMLFNGQRSVGSASELIDLLRQGPSTQVGGLDGCDQHSLQVRVGRQVPAPTGIGPNNLLHAWLQNKPRHLRDKGDTHAVHKQADGLTYPGPHFHGNDGYFYVENGPAGYFRLISKPGTSFDRARALDTLEDVTFYIPNPFDGRFLVEDQVASQVNEQNRAKRADAFQKHMDEVDRRNATNQVMAGVAIAVGVALFATAVKKADQPTPATVCNKTNSRLSYALAKEEPDNLGSNPNLFTPKVTTEGPFAVDAGACRELMVPTTYIWWLSFFRKTASGLPERLVFSGDDNRDVSPSRRVHAICSAVEQALSRNYQAPTLVGKDCPEGAFEMPVSFGMMGGNVNRQTVNLLEK